jgi:hypothetical protein
VLTYENRHLKINSIAGQNIFLTGDGLIVLGNVVLVSMYWWRGGTEVATTVGAEDGNQKSVDNDTYLQSLYVKYHLQVKNEYVLKQCKYFMGG